MYSVDKVQRYYDDIVDSFVIERYNNAVRDFTILSAAQASQSKAEAKQRFKLWDGYRKKIDPDHIRPDKKAKQPLKSLLKIPEIHIKKDAKKEDKD